MKDTKKDVGKKIEATDESVQTLKEKVEYMEKQLSQKIDFEVFDEEMSELREILAEMSSNSLAKDNSKGSMVTATTPIKQRTSKDTQLIKELVDKTNNLEEKIKKMMKELKGTDTENIKNQLSKLFAELNSKAS